MADPPSMPDHPLGEIGPLLSRNQLSYLPLDLHGIKALRPSKTSTEATEVGIDSYPRSIEGMAQNYICSLPSHSRQSHQLFQGFWDPSAKLVLDSNRELLDVLRLGAKEPCWFDDRLDGSKIG